MHVPLTAAGRRVRRRPGHLPRAREGTSDIDISMNRDRRGRPLEGLDRIDALNRVRFFLDAAYLMIEQSGRVKGTIAILFERRTRCKARLWRQSAGAAFTGRVGRVPQPGQAAPVWLTKRYSAASAVGKSESVSASRHRHRRIDAAAAWSRNSARSPLPRL